MTEYYLEEKGEPEEVTYESLLRKIEDDRLYKLDKIKKNGKAISLQAEGKIIKDMLKGGWAILRDAKSVSLFPCGFDS